MKESGFHDPEPGSGRGVGQAEHSRDVITDREIDDVTEAAPLAPATDGPAAADPETPVPLFADDTRQDLRSRWESIQAEFVDEPRSAVEQADRLVAETTERLTDSFAEIRRQLEDEWKRGDDVSTEDLRLALRRYRSFFGKLVSA